MYGKGDFTRLAAALFTAAVLIAVIIYPNAGRQAVERVAAVSAAAAPLAADRPCAIGEAALAGPFAPLEDVLSVSPLGGVTAPGETLPAPYIRINTRRGDTGFTRQTTTALAPAKADITAIERRLKRDDSGRVVAGSWTVHFQVCQNVSFYYEGLDQIDESILKRAGGLDAFTELGGPDHIAAETHIRVQTGDVIGEAAGFDVGLHDRAAAPAALERPERYRTNPYARAAAFDAPPSLIAAITPDITRARCPIDYLPKDEQPAWAAKLGDSWNIRKAKGDNACRTALIDTVGAAEGVWYTDSAHNAAVTKVSAVALAPDTIDPDRLIFSLHGRLSSLAPDLIGLSPFMEQERKEAAKDFLTAESGDGRINTPFDHVRDGQVYCYEKLRTNFVGPLINGVLLLERESGDDGPALLKMEVRGDASSCIDLAEPWSFSGDETIFYR